MFILQKLIYFDFYNRKIWAEKNNMIIGKFIHIEESWLCLLKVKKNSPDEKNTNKRKFASIIC